MSQVDSLVFYINWSTNNYCYVNYYVTKVKSGTWTVLYTMHVNITFFFGDKLEKQGNGCDFYMYSVILLTALLWDLRFTLTRAVATKHAFR